MIVFQRLTLDAWGRRAGVERVLLAIERRKFL